MVIVTIKAQGTPDHTFVASTGPVAKAMVEKMYPGTDTWTFSELSHSHSSGSDGHGHVAFIEPIAVFTEENLDAKHPLRKA